MQQQIITSTYSPNFTKYTKILPFQGGYLEAKKDNDGISILRYSASENTEETENILATWLMMGKVTGTDVNSPQKVDEFMRKVVSYYENH